MASKSKSKKVKFDAAFATLEEREAIEAFKESLPDDTYIDVPDNALITFPISGLFRKELRTLQRFIENDLSEQELMEIYLKINSDPIELGKAINEGKITLDNNYWAVRTIITLNMEIDYQAAKQGVTCAYDADELNQHLASGIQQELKQEALTKEELEKRMSNKKTPSSEKVVIKPKTSNED